MIIPLIGSLSTGYSSHHLVWLTLKHFQVIYIFFPCITFSYGTFQTNFSITTVLIDIDWKWVLGLSGCSVVHRLVWIHLNIPRKGIARPQSPFMCLWAIFIFPRFICLLCCRKYVDCGPIPWEYINRSQTHECGNWDWGRANPRKGIYKWDFRCSASSRSMIFICLFEYVWRDMERSE